MGHRGGATFERRLTLYVTQSSEAGDGSSVGICLGLGLGLELGLELGLGIELGLGL